MKKHLLAPDRVLLLLSLISYLREHGPTPVPKLAEVFEVSPKLLRELVSFLGTAGVPGETLTYQHEDLFDIDWDALLNDDVASLTRTVAIDETPRFASSETAALLAGLQSLTTMLSDDDAALARELAARLGSALGARATSITVSAEPQDPRVPQLVDAIDGDRAIAFPYRDAGGRRSRRTVDPLELRQTGETWYLRGYCHDREAERTFRLDQMGEIRDAGPRAGRAAAPYLPDVVAARARVEFPAGGGDDREGAGAEEGADRIVFRVSRAGLEALSGFAPEAIGEAADGSVRASVEAWHGATAILLVQRGLGSVVIESPEAAREAVRSWAEEALAPYDE